MYNKSILIGRLTVDPELKTTQTGKSVCAFRIAVDRRFSGKDGERKTDFINIVSFRNTAEFVSKFFTKGKLIGVDGSIQTRDYTDRDGNKRIAFEVIADQCFFVESKSNSTGNSDTEENAYENIESMQDSSDLPF